MTIPIIHQQKKLGKDGIITIKNENMIAIIQVNKRKTVMEASTAEEAVNEAKRIINLPKSKVKQCNIIICKETELYTIKKPN